MKKGKTMRRMLAALLAVLLCMSCIGGPMAFAAEGVSNAEPSAPPQTVDAEQSAEGELEETPAPEGEADKENPEATPVPEGEADKENPEATPAPEGEAAQAFVDAVAVLDRDTILSTANTWGLAHKAWLEDQGDHNLQAALDAATAASDKAAAALYAAEDLYYTIPEAEQDAEEVQAAYLSLMSIVVAMHEKMDNPTVARHDF